MASNIRTRLPCVSGSEQTIASAFLGSQPSVEPEASRVGSRTYVASGDARQINGPVSTTFTGSIGKVDAYFTGPTGVDTHQQALAWLGSTSHSTVHKKAWKSQEPETGLWFLEGETFNRWRTEPSSLIWLHGGVGCGKTVLCSSIIEKVRNIHELAGSQDDFALCYFYCSFQDGTRMELGAILRLFLASICDQYKATAQLRALYAECHRTFPAEEPSNDQLQTTLFAILEDSITKSDKLAADRTSATASHVPYSTGMETYLFIDALDEIPLPERECVLEFLQELSSLRLPHLHVLATSRNEPAIEEAMTRPINWTAVPIDKESVNVDIDRYVSKAIESYPRLRNQPKATKHLILLRLVKAADGMFRWAALQIAAIKRLKPIHPITIEQVLNKLPPDLNETYARILAQVHESLLYQASAALKWLALSVRPLYIEELLEACAIHPERIPILDKEDHRLRPSDLLEMLYELISIDPPISDPSRTPHSTHRVALSHFSVQEFLMSNDIVRLHNKFFRVSLHDSHLFLARCCLAYLYYHNSNPERGDQRPLREYAWYHWERHVDPRPEQAQNRIRRKAVKFYHMLSSRVQDLEPAIDWMPAHGLQRLKEALNVPFFYKDFAHFDDQQLDDAKHVYDPLPGRAFIRLLMLLPCLDERTDLKCKLHVADLRNRPQYDALSYVWGAPETNEIICINGSRYFIRRNLASILRRLRQQEMHNTLHLWVDTLCINQDDIEERSVQVSIMGTIFREAREVVIAFGDSKGTDEIGIEYIANLAWATTQASQEILRETVLRIDRDNGWPAITGLFASPWWCRSWVIQEVVLAANATFLFGELSLSLNVLDLVLRSADIILEISKTTGKYDEGYRLLEAHSGWQSALAISLTRRDRYNGSSFMLPRLLWRFREHKVTDPRDRIYSLLGMTERDSPYELNEWDGWIQSQTSHRRMRNAPSVNYALSVEDIHKNYACYFLEESKNLDILSYCSSCDRPGKDGSLSSTNSLPSWVPWFAEASLIVPLTLGIFDGQDSMAVFSAGGLGSALEYEVVDDGVTLRLHGYCVDHIVKIFEIDFGPGYLFKVLVSVELDWIMSRQTDTAGKSPRNEPCLEAFWRTILADQWHQGKRINQDDLHKRAIPPRSFEDHYLLLKDPELYPHLRYILGRRIIITQRGYLGLAPRAANNGDTVAIIPGGALSYILRPSGASSTKASPCSAR